MGRISQFSTHCRITQTIFLTLFLILSSIFSAPITKSNTLDDGTYAILSIKIHRIKKIDEIENVLEEGADWYFRVCIYDGEWHNTSNVYVTPNSDDVLVDKTFDFSIHCDEITFCIILMESDFWTKDDLADISSYPGGGTDNNVTLSRGAVFMAHYNLHNNSIWGDKVNILVEINGNYTESYYYTSGTMDGSNEVDENDAIVSFQIWHTQEIIHYNPNDDILNILQITDIHISTSDNESLNNLEEMVNVINEIHPDILLVTGDLVDGATNQDYEKFNEIMSSVLPEIDVEYIVGNHDIRVAGDFTDHSYAWYHYYISSQSDRILVDKYYSHGYVLLGLNSNQKYFGLSGLNDYSGEINETQLEWLNEQINSYNNTKQIIIFMHHPVFSDVTFLTEDSTISDNLTARDSFIDLCEQPDENGYSKVSLVLTGHTHTDGVWEENGRDGTGHYPIIGKKLFPMERGYYNNFYDKKTKFIHTLSVKDSKAYKLIQLCGKNAVYKTYTISYKNPLPTVGNVSIYPDSVVNQGEEVYVYAQVSDGESGVKMVKCIWSEDKINWEFTDMEEIGNETYKTHTPIDTSTILYGGKVFCRVVVENRDDYLAVSEINFSINIPPVTNFTWTPLNPKVSDIIQFIDSSYDSDGAIVNYTWNFGDGNISYKQNPIHTYSNYGLYDVTLTVRDDKGWITNISKKINITLPPLPTRENPPTDPDRDRLFEDLNGNGLIDFDDVVEYFKYFEWIENNYGVNLVDFNLNGRIDFDDVVELFKEVEK